MRAGFALAGFAEKGFADGAGWKHPGFLSQALRFFGKTFFKGQGLLDTATLHDNLPSRLRVLPPHGSALGDPNMRAGGRLFPSEQFTRQDTSNFE
jgi:hypothetical protein